MKMRVTILILAVALISSMHASPSPNDNKAQLRTVAWYRKKPHDTALYDILNVRHDASQGEIAKSYRRLSLEWHPDKIRRRKLKEDRKRKGQVSSGVPPPPPPPSDTKATSNIEEFARNRLQQISDAYEILANDQTRLLYHRYGIQNGIEGAVQLLTGKLHSSPSNNIDSNEQMRLLQLMGHPPHLAHDAKEARIYYLTSSIVEKLRPLVEGTISQDMYVQSIYDDCIALSKSALGKQILRCVGRAYRREGYRVLRTMNKSNSGLTKQTSRQHKITDAIHDSWSSIRHLTSAAVASSKLVMVESKLKRLQSEREKRRISASEKKLVESRASTSFNLQSDSSSDNLLDTAFIDNIGALPDESDDETIDEIGSMFSDDEADADIELDDSHFQHLANEKTYNALITAHQTEVLWKLTKIDLDSTIRDACRRMLESNSRSKNGEWFSFFPSENSPYPHDWHHNPSDMPNMQYHQDGWVCQDGNVIQTEVGRLRAAAALVLVGDIMVRCGKGLQ